jgi:hypothetical protein
LEGDQEVMKRSGRDEPIWVVIHMCMETTQGISLNIYVYLKLQRLHVFLTIFYNFFFYKNQRTREWNRFSKEAGMEWGGGPNNYTHVSKCKNKKRKEKN